MIHCSHRVAPVHPETGVQSHNPILCCLPFIPICFSLRPAPFSFIPLIGTRALPFLRGGQCKGHRPTHVWVPSSTYTQHALHALHARLTFHSRPFPAFLRSNSVTVLNSEYHGRLRDRAGSCFQSPRYNWFPHGPGLACLTGGRVPCMLISLQGPR